MSKTNQGGHAFPTLMTANSHSTPGMSLRDYFAGKALQMIVINDTSGRPENFRELYSKGAYEWADAMIEARESK